MTLPRRKSRPVKVGNLIIGGGAPVSVQTMVKASPDDINAIMAQINEAAELGCNLIRLAIPNRAALQPFAEVKRQSPLPLVADIHFNEHLAIGAIEAGADKVRINPGNMKDWEAITAVVKAAQQAGAAIRIGVNSGSIRPRKGEDNRDLATALSEDALYYLERIEAMGFDQIVVSLKASDAPTTIAANLAVAGKMDYPLHLGVTAAGPEEDSILKSAIGVGGLLAQGIGDTIRLSFTGSPAAEVRAGKELLRAVGLLRDRVEIISCPTCGRCQVDLQEMAAQAKARLAHIRKPLKVAVMGCEVNGPGEAAECDVGIAAGKGKYALFRDGKLLKTITETEALDVLCAEVEALAEKFDD
ncbi:MAG: flavodoxin-dependent (E)-4-hydroxy-3-methylbut-2-enyl-diphosphate synthase [Planctomycetes bacterium]|nr:flavodoxin-dependent (E)-4-hydroxy-3-methylbut-2-enyl-diphosphate synthase [Planctomycetota bacterium]